MLSRAPWLVGISLALTACASRARPASPPPPLPRAAYAHYLRGQVALTEGDRALAVQELRAAQAAAPDEAPIAIAVIDALLRAGRAVDAQEAASIATGRWPRDAGVWLVAGHVHRRRGDAARAGAAYERAIELDDDREAAYVGLATTWQARGRVDRAEKTWRRLLDEVPSSVDGHYRLAAILLQRDHGFGERARAARRDALPHLRAVLERDPDHIDARLDLARALRLEGDLPGALATTRQAFDRAGNPVDIGEELFWLLCEADDRRGALDLLGLLDDPAAEADTRVVLSRLYGSVGELERSLAQARAALVAAPASGDAALALARAQRARGEGEAAIATALSIADTAPAMPSARVLAADILVDAGDSARALALVEAARVLYPRDADLLLAHALALHARGRDADARGLLDAAVRARPRHAGLLFAWASFEDDTGHPDRATAYIDRLLAARPDDVAALNFAGFTRADRGVDLERAEDLLARARALAPGDPDVLDSWGWLLHRRGRHREAAAALGRAARIDTREPEILVHLGEVWATLGDSRQARAVLERARGLAPPPRLRARIDARLTALRR